MSERPLVIGVGNQLRGDDGAGLRVAELLTARGVEAVRCDGEPIELLDLWASRPAAIVVDAVPGTSPGRIWRLDAAAGELPAAFAERTSTHLIGLAEVIELGRSLGRLPTELTVIGIEGADFGLGRRLSAAVERAAAEVTSTLAAEA
jgi:hydrogenase maturation protease